MQRITSRQHPIVLQTRAIARGKDPGMLLDGVHLVAEAVDARRVIQAAVVDTAELERADLRGVIARLTRAGVPVFAAPKVVMAAVSAVKTASPIVAVADRPVWSLDALFANRPPLVVIAAGVQDPGNLGAIVRVAEAAGASGLLAAGACADPFGWKAVRGSMGSALRLPIAISASPLEAVAEARRRGCRIVATVARRGSALHDTDLTGPLAVLVGREGSGLDRSVSAASDVRVTIPMQPPVESLNAAVATAVIVYEARRQRTGS
jgi:TrmH family RNA methyltransferase